MAVSCQKTDDIRPIIPIAPPDTDTIVPSDPVPALFSVSDTQQVRFSPGNLQYVEGHWRFAEHQTDFLGTFDLNHCDLFGWPAANTNWGVDSTKDNWMHYDGDFMDWGTNPALIADLGNGWRTLSADEWDYLLNRRQVNGSAGEGNSWIAARINGQYGLIIYPDRFTRQTSTLGTIPDSCVFLPAPGSRLGNQLYYVGNEYGFYRSSTPSDIRWYANYISFYQSTSTTHLQITSGDREAGLSVRLVRDF
jgi:hypothetical protein